MAVTGQGELSLCAPKETPEVAEEAATGDPLLPPPPPKEFR